MLTQTGSIAIGYKLDFFVLNKFHLIKKYAKFSGASVHLTKHYHNNLTYYLIITWDLLGLKIDERYRNVPVFCSMKNTSYLENS